MLSKIKEAKFYILAFLVLEVLLLVLFQYLLINETEKGFQQKLSQTKSIYSTAINNYHQFAENLSLQIINDNRLKDVIFSASEANTASRRYYKNELENSLKSKLSGSFPYFFQNMVIHIPVEQNYVSLKEIKNSGLFNNKGSVNKVFEQGYSISGFDVDDNGYNYVFLFPVKQNQNIRAVIEIVLPFVSLNQAIKKSNSNQNYLFIIKTEFGQSIQDIIESEGNKTKFGNQLVSSDVFSEEKSFIDPKIVKAVNDELADQFNTSLTSDDSFGINYKIDEENYTATFLILDDINKKNSTVILSVSENQQLFITQLQFIFFFSLSTLVIGALLSLSYIEFQNRIKAQRTNAILNSIKESPKDVYIYALDRNYKFVAFSQSYRKIFYDITGAKIELGYNKLNYHSDLLEQREIKKNLNNAIKGEQIIEIERHQLPKIGTRFFEVRYNPIRIDDGSTFGVTVFITDITENKLAEKKLKAVNDELEEQINAKGQYEKILKSNNNFLNTVIDTIPSPFYFQNKNGILQGCNIAFANDILGKSKRQVVGKSVRELLADKVQVQLDSLMENDAKLMMNSGMQTYETPVLYNDQKIHEVIFYKATFNDVNNKVDGLVTVMLDITDRKRSEEILKKSKESAEDANKAKSVFLANMSHELRTPLNGILGYAQLLKMDKGLNESQKQAIDTIHHSGEHLLSLINDVLDLSKIEARKLDLVITQFNIRELISNIANIFNLRSEKKGLRFFFETDNELPRFVKGDEVRLRQIIYNLLGNAVKFTNSGGVTLKISHQYIDDKIQFNIKVIDTGIGIPQDKLKEIFLPFHQVGDIKKKAEGTGLGLAITFTLVQLMNGKINVRSNVGHGTTFEITLLLESVKNEEIEQPLNNKQIIGYEGITKKILLADSSEDSRIFMSNLLTQVGFQIFETADCNETVDVIRSNMPDIILIDNNIGGDEVCDLIKKIKHDISINHIPIIALSASAYEEDQMKSLEAGSDQFLAKPVVVSKLFASLGKLLNLNWRYESEEFKVNESIEFSAKNSLKFTDNELLPDYKVIKEINRLALGGDISGINGVIQSLDKDMYQVFLKKLRHMADRYDVEEILKYTSDLLG